MFALASCQTREAEPLPTIAEWTEPLAVSRPAPTLATSEPDPDGVDCPLLPDDPFAGIEIIGAGRLSGRISDRVVKLARGYFQRFSFPSGAAFGHVSSIACCKRGGNIGAIRAPE